MDWMQALHVTTGEIAPHNVKSWMFSLATSLKQGSMPSQDNCCFSRSMFFTLHRKAGVVNLIRADSAKILDVSHEQLQEPVTTDVL